MKRILLIINCSILFFAPNLNAQCIGGAFASNLTPTTSWQFVNSVSGGNYYTFTGTAGNVYTFSFCSADGGSSIYDTQISLLNSFGNTVDLAYFLTCLGLGYPLHVNFGLGWMGFPRLTRSIGSSVCHHHICSKYACATLGES